MHVTNQISLATKFLHLTVYDNTLEVHISGLISNPNQNSNVISSDQLLHFAVVGNEYKTNEIIFSNNYTSIEYLNDKSGKLIAVPFKTKDFDIIILNNKNSYDIMNRIETPHWLKYFQIQAYATFFITFGIDGLVNVWDSNTFQIITSFLPHNKLSGGVRKCVADTGRRCFE